VSQPIAPVQRVRRALLFTPGDDLHKLEKAAALGVDSIILDLEDGVALSRKVQARQTIVQALQTLDFGRSERLVRINAINSGLELDDLEETLPAHPDGYVMSKVEFPEHVQWVSSQIGEAERRAGWPTGAIRLLAMVETAQGIVNLKDIARSTERLDALIFGAEDLVGSLGAIRTRDGWEVFYARSAVVVHAAAFGLQAIDMIYADFNDVDGLVAETEQAVQMGYSGKTAIHPRQVGRIAQVFIPTDEAIASAERLVAAFEAHQANGTGAFALDGKMVDAPMILAAERVLARARAAGKVP
jgi:citrate lyase beta subunit